MPGEFAWLNTALNVVAVVLVIVAVVVYARAQGKIKTVDTWRDAAQAERARADAEAARAEERGQAIERATVQLRECQETLRVEKERPDVGAVMAALSATAEENQHRYEQGMVQIAELFGKQREGLDQVLTALRAHNGG